MPSKPADPRSRLAALRTFAMALPDTSEGVACEGTSLEKRTIETGGKAFAFFGAADLMLKLDVSLAEAARQLCGYVQGR